VPAKKDIEAELIKIVGNEIAADPIELDGHLWANIETGHEGLAAFLGVSTKTIARRLSEPPFKTRVIKPKGAERRTLLRFRDPDEPDFTPDEQRRAKANQDSKAMGVAWHTSTGRWPSYDERNRLWGFAYDLCGCPVEPVDIFRDSIKNWTHTASAIKLAQKAIPGGKPRYYDFPTIGPMRLFWRAVLHAYVSRLMEAGKVPPDLPNGEVSTKQLNFFMAILNATDFAPINEEPSYTEDHIEELIAKKAAKKAAMVSE